MESYLSDNVKHQLVTIGKDILDDNFGHNNCYLNSENVINWNFIDNIFDDCFDIDFEIHNFNFEWHVRKIRDTFPVYLDADFHFKNIDKKNIQTSLQYLDWTHRLKDIQYYFANSSVQDSTYCLEGILLLSSILERALGNVYLMQGDSVPFLLRDLLNTPEITTMFGKTPILFLQILIGTPKSLNLRNLVWHGFPHNDELHSCYVSILVITINSLGFILKQKSIIYETIPVRSQMINLVKFTKTILTYNTLPQLPDTTIIHNLLQTNSYLKSQLPVFTKIMNYYETKQNGRFLLLFLPQFEHFMRKIFCEINSMPERVKSAENDTFYTTLDDIFLYKLSSNDPNAIYELFGEDLLVFYHDLFTFQEGPRIRDKFSHGEIDFDYIPDTFVDILLTLFVLFVSKTNRRGDCDVCIENYNSVFHSNAILKYNILNLKDQLELDFPCSDYFDTPKIDLSNLTNLIKQFEEVAKLSFSNNLYQMLVNEKVPTLTRSKFEVQIIGVLNRIVKITANVDNSFRKLLCAKFEIYQNKKLHSRQRQSFVRMVSFAPFLFETFLLINLITTFHAVKIWRFEEMIHEIDLRNLKKLEQCIERIESNIVLDKNQWDSIKTWIENIVMVFNKQLYEKYLRPKNVNDNFI